MPLLRGDRELELRDIVERKSAVIRGWVEAERLAPLDPEHVIFMIWATTRHHADFAVQVQALTGETLANPVFFEKTVANVQALVLNGAGPREVGTTAASRAGAARDRERTGVPLD